MVVFDIKTKLILIIYIMSMLMLSDIYCQTNNNKLNIVSGLESIFSYQAVLRDKNGMVLANTDVQITISIHQKTDDGVILFKENHSVVTNKFGLIDIHIGEGNTENNINSIDWSEGPYFIRVELNGKLLGITKIMAVPMAVYAGITKKFIKGDYNNLINKLDTKKMITEKEVYNMMSMIPVSEKHPEGSLEGQVYYNAKTNTVFSFDGSIWKPIEASSGGIFSKLFSDLLAESSNAGGNKVSDLKDPEDDQDATTKKYVDDKIAFSSSATYISNTEPESPTLGFVYMNNIDKKLYYWNGTSWIPVGMNGQLFWNMLVINSSAGGHFIRDLVDPVDEKDVANKRYTDNAISGIDNSTPTGDALPANSGIGDIFYKTTEKLLYYFDGINWIKMGGNTTLLSTLLSENSSADNNRISNIGAHTDQLDAVRKIDVDNRISSASQSILISSDVPTDPLLGEIYFNTTDKGLYYYNGNDWVKLNSESLYLSKMLDSDNSAGLNKISSLGNPVNDSDAANKKYVETKINSVTPTTTSGTNLPENGESGELFFNTTENKLYYYNSNEWLPVDSNSSQLLSTILKSNNSAGGTRIINVGDPVDNQDAMTKGYVDALKSGTQVFFKEKTFTIGFDGNWNNEMVPLWRTPADKTISITEVKAYAVGSANAQLKFNLEVRPVDKLSNSGTVMFSNKLANSEGNKIRSFQSGSNINITAKSHIVLTTTTDVNLVGSVNSLKVTVYYQE